MPEVQVNALVPAEQSRSEAALAQQAVRAVKHGTADCVDDDIEPGRGLAGTPGLGADEAFPPRSPTKPAPRPATMPDISWDGMTGVRSLPSRVIHSRSQVSSAKVIAAARTAFARHGLCEAGLMARRG